MPKRQPIKCKLLLALFDHKILQLTYLLKLS
jgi:hypothetical protein